MSNNSIQKNTSKFTQTLSTVQNTFSGFASAIYLLDAAAISGITTTFNITDALLLSNYSDNEELFQIYIKELLLKNLSDNNIKLDDIECGYIRSIYSDHVEDIDGKYILTDPDISTEDESFCKNYYNDIIDNMSKYIVDLLITKLFVSFYILYSKNVNDNNLESKVMEEEYIVTVN